MTAKQIREIFRQRQVQLGAGSLEMIEQQLLRIVDDMARRCDEGNIKRLTPKLFHLAIADLPRWARPGRKRGL